MISERDEVKKWYSLFFECRFSYCGSRPKYFYPRTEESVCFCLENGEVWSVYFESSSRIITPVGCYEVYGKDLEKLEEFWKIMEE